MNQRNKSVLALFSLPAILLCHLDALAIREPRALSSDSRIRVITYSPNEVFKYTGYYGYSTYIEFEMGETIDTISMGNTTLWQITPSGNRIFLKPNEGDASTNMTIITNMRLYFFTLQAEHASGIDDPNLVFSVKFLYPESNLSSLYMNSNLAMPDLTKPEKYNFNYTISGSSLTAPLKIFDDGRFTYFEFGGANSPIPAIFEVDAKRNESIINYQVLGRYIIVESIASRFTLRYGDEITCVFNESKPLK